MPGQSRRVRTPSTIERLAELWTSLASVDDRRWRQALLVIVVVAAVARVAMIVATPGFVPWGDPVDYQRHGATIAAGHGFPPTGIATPGTPSALRAPAYPYLLGVAYAVGGTNPQFGRLVGAGLGVLTVVLLAYLGRAVWDRRLGLFAGGLAAVFLPLIALNASLLSEALFLPLELGFALCLVRLARTGGSARWAMFAGVVCGLAALTRTLGLLFLLASLAVTAMACTGGWSRIRSMVALIGALIVVLTPWTIRNADAFHAFVPISTQGGFSLAGQYNQEAGRDDQLQAVWRVPSQVATLRDPLLRLAVRTRGKFNEVQLDSTLRHAAVTYLGDHPAQVPIAIWLNALRMFDLGKGHEFTTGIAYREMGLPHPLRNPTTLCAQVIALIALGGIIARLAGRLHFSAGPWWLWALAVLAIAAAGLASGTPRYRAPADPFLILLAALTLTAVIDRSVARLQRPRPIPAAAA